MSKKIKKLSLAKIIISKLNSSESSTIYGGTNDGDGCGGKSKIIITPDCPLNITLKYPCDQNHSNNGFC